MRKRRGGVVGMVESIAFRPACPPPETSPLSPLPSPSHRPGEGDFAEAVVLVGGVFRIGNAKKKYPIGSPLQSGPPLPDGGRAMGEGLGVRFRPTLCSTLSPHETRLRHCPVLQRRAGLHAARSGAP